MSNEAEPDRFTERGRRQRRANRQSVRSFGVFRVFGGSSHRIVAAQGLGWFRGGRLSPGERRRQLRLQRWSMSAPVPFGLPLPAGIASGHAQPTRNDPSFAGQSPPRSGCGTRNLEATISAGAGVRPRCMCDLLRDRRYPPLRVTHPTGGEGLPRDLVAFYRLVYHISVRFLLRLP